MSQVSKILVKLKRVTVGERDLTTLRTPRKSALPVRFGVIKSLYMQAFQVRIGIHHGALSADFDRR
jgi:hypothetical protein